MIPLVPFMTMRSPGKCEYVKWLESLRKWQKEKPSKWHFIKYSTWKKQRPIPYSNSFKEEND